MHDEITATRRLCRTDAGEQPLRITPHCVETLKMVQAPSKSYYKAVYYTMSGEQLPLLCQNPRTVGLQAPKFDFRRSR